jgi:hypothetical protein
MLYQLRYRTRGTATRTGNRQIKCSSSGIRRSSALSSASPSDRLRADQQIARHGSYKDVVPLAFGPCLANSLQTCGDNLVEKRLIVILPLDHCGLWPQPGVEPGPTRRYAEIRVKCGHIACNPLKIRWLIGVD